MIKAIAIDDEPVALDIIRLHAQRVPFLKLTGLFSSASKALEFLKTEKVDLVFLDIKMPGIGGLEFAALIEPVVQIIFTTAHPTYALTGFDLAITDFLLKPINYDRFLQACTLAHDRLAVGARPAERNEALFVKDGYNWVKINLQELLYVKAEDNYVNMVLPGRHILTRMPLQEVMGKLPADRFLRVHKSYIVNIGQITQLESHQVTVGSLKVPVSKQFMGSLKKYLSIQ